MPKKRICFFLLFCLFVFGCGKQLDHAQRYARKAQLYYEKAIQLYEKYLKQGRNVQEASLALGLLYYQRGDFEKAIRQLKDLSSKEAQKFLGLAYYKLGDYTQALDVFRKLKNWQDAEYLFYYGLTCERLNLYEQALELYQAIDKSSPYSQKAAEKKKNIQQHSNIDLSQLDPETRELILHAPGQESYAQAGALFLFVEETFEITKDNTLVSTTHCLIKILNERGKKEFAEIETEYDSTFERVELESARVIKPDGTLISVGQKHLRDVSKYLNFPLYSNVRVHIISFPQVSEGAILEYKIKTYRNQLVNQKDFCLVYPLQAMDPVLFCRFSVTLPKERDLKIKLLNERYNDFSAQLNPRLIQDKDKKTYLWEFRDIPQIIPEIKMPPVEEINPAISVSTFDHWHEVYQWWWGLAKDKIKANAQIKEKVKELTQGMDSPYQKAQAIYNFCAQEIRYVAVEYGQAGYEPHTAEEVFNNKYGDCKDQTILLVAMLREAGLEAWPVLISTKDFYPMQKDFPSIKFNHAISVVFIDGQKIFMDPTCQTCSFGDLPSDDQQRTVLIFQADKYTLDKTVLSLVSQNQVKEELYLKVDVLGNVKAEKRVSTSGYYDQGQRFWLLYTAPKVVEEMLKGKIQEIVLTGQLENVYTENVNDLTKGVILSYTFSGSDYFTLAGELYILPQLSKLDAAVFAPEVRHYPLWFEVPDKFIKYFEIELPKELQVKFMPPDIKRDSAWLNYRATYRYQGNKIYFQEERETKCIEINPQEYPRYKAFMEEILKSIKQRVVLEKKR